MAMHVRASVRERLRWSRYPFVVGPDGGDAGSSADVSGPDLGGPTTDATPTVDARPPIDARPPSDTGAPIDATPDDPFSDCPSCITARCDSDLIACTSDTNCQPGLDCVNSCPTPAGGKRDPACVAKCTASVTDARGAALLDALLTCAHDRCAKSCAM
jgi:hypothetical protein